MKNKNTLSRYYRYNLQYVTLKTYEGLAKNKKNLKEIWRDRCKEYFAHYKVVNTALYRGKGKKRK